MGYLFGFIIWGIIWGFATKAVIENKNYSENWFWWGFFFGIIAFIVALAKPENRSYDSYNSYSGTPVTSFDRDPYDFGKHTSNANASLFGDKSQEMLRQSGWKCDCGRVNAAYIGTCVCGRSKSDVGAARSQAIQESKKTADEAKTLEALKEYKKLFDEGVLTQEEFDAKKKALLGL